MNRSLHIVHTESSCGWGGQEIRILSEATGMMDRGHQVTLLSPPEARIFEAAQRVDINVVALPIGRKSVAGIWSLRRWLDSVGKNVDIINCHSSTDTWLTALAVAVMQCPPPLVRTRHVSSPINHLKITRWLYQSAVRHVVTTGEALRQQLHRDNGFALDSMTSVPTGIDLTRFAPRDRVEARAKLGLLSAHYLGIVGTLRNWKGHVDLVDAFATLAPAYPDWRLLIIGDGPQRQNLRLRIENLGLTAQIKMVGHQEDMPLWFNAMDVFVLPSYGDEGVPQAITQAMACGLPVVSTSVGAIEEAVVAGSTGLIVPPRDVGALSAAISRMFDDAYLRRSLGAAGLTRAKENFGIARMLDQMEPIFLHHARPYRSSC